MNRPEHIFASIVTAAVLAATPAVATLCAMLCPSAAASTAATVEPHHEHQGEHQAEHQAEHHAEHHAAEAAHDGRGAEPAAAGAQHHGSPFAHLTAPSTHGCCDGESLAPRALTTRRLDSGTVSSAPAADDAAPLASCSTVPLPRTTAVRSDAHPVSRPPLVLRI